MESENPGGVFRKLSEVQGREAEWFWSNRVPIPGITLLEGDGGIGKSFLTADIVARATQGKSLPGDIARNPINVALLALEDDPEVVLKPRYDAQGANCDRVFFFDKSFHLNTKNLEILEKEIVLNEIGLLIIDPVIAYFPAGDTNKSKDVRDFMGGVHELSKKHSLAVIAIRHWNKNSAARASQRGVGSVDFRNASRSVLQVIKTESQLFLALEKSNYAAEAKSLTFCIKDSKLVWGEESDLTADEILGMANGQSQEDKSAIQDAKDFIVEMLRNGPVPAKEMNRLAKEEGIATITLRRAREQLGIKAKKVGDLSGRSYTLPDNTEVDHVDQSFSI